MISLKRKLALRAQASAGVAAARKAEAVGRTTQIAHSTVPVGDTDVPVVEAVSDATIVAGEMPGVRNEITFAGDDAFDAVIQVGDVRDTAEQAAIDAAAATETALGFARYAQVDGEEIIPELPVDGPRVGAELVHIDVTGHPYQVDAWNGTEWTKAQYLADSLLVLGEGGTVQIADGILSAQSIAAESFYGYSFVGAEFVQEASEDLVAFYPTTPGEIIETDWMGGRPDNWGDVAVSTTVKDSGTQSIYVSRGTGTGSLSALWTNNDRVPPMSTAPRGIELRVRATNVVTGVHVTTPDGTQQLDDVPANIWTSLVVDVPDDTSLDWIHLGVTAPASTILYVDVVKVLAMDASGAFLAITRTGAGLPGMFIVNSDGEMLGDVTPFGLRSFAADGTGYARLHDGELTAAKTSASGEVEHFTRVSPDGISTPYGRMGRTFSGTTADRYAYGISVYVRTNDRFFDEDENREYTWTGSAWRWIRGVDDTDAQDLSPYLKTGVTGTPTGWINGRSADISGSLTVAVPSGTDLVDLVTTANPLPEKFWPTTRNRWGTVWANGLSASVVVRPDGSMSIANRSGTNIGTGTPVQFTISYIRG